MTIAARVTKYGFTFHEALFEVPLAVLQQLIIYDDLYNGRQPRWRMEPSTAVQSIDEVLTLAMTPSE